MRTWYLRRRTYLVPVANTVRSSIGMFFSDVIFFYFEVPLVPGTFFWCLFTLFSFSFLFFFRSRHGEIPADAYEPTRLSSL